MVQDSLCAGQLKKKASTYLTDDDPIHIATSATPYRLFLQIGPEDVWGHY